MLLGSFALKDWEGNRESISSSDLLKINSGLCGIRGAAVRSHLCAPHTTVMSRDTLQTVIHIAGNSDAASGFHIGYSQGRNLGGKISIPK